MRVAAQGNLKVLVVDDDFMIGRIHRQYVDAMLGFSVVGVAGSAAEALSLLKETHPDLLLLDVYLPDRSGIELIAELRAHKCNCDIILVTAAKELKVVEEGFRMGVFDYLVKPFNLDLLGVSLKKYAKYKSKFSASTVVDQGVVDHLKKIRATELAEQPDHESGIDGRTLDRIRVTLERMEYAYTAEEIAKEAGVSRSTARTYLDYMVDKGLAAERLSYGTVGRPRRLFRRRGD
jgi:response regulator of citrate/malate metabolism